MGPLQKDTGQVIAKYGVTWYTAVPEMHKQIIESQNGRAPRLHVCFVDRSQEQALDNQHVRNVLSSFPPNIY